MALHSMVLHPHSWVGEDRLINELCCIAPLPSWAGHDSFTLHLSDIAKSKRSLLKHSPSAAEQNGQGSYDQFDRFDVRLCQQTQSNQINAMLSLQT